MATFQNNNRIANIRKNQYGEFVAFVGYTDASTNSMQVIDCKSYKRESSAIKFCTQWVEA